MANGIIKTVADLCTQVDTDLPDNAGGLISPADVRNAIKNLIASAASHIGGLHISTVIETGIASAGTFVKAAGTTLAFSGNNQFSMPTSNRLQYTGNLSNRVFVINASLSITAAMNNQLIHLMLVKNGNVADAESITTIQEITHGIGAEIDSHTLTGHFTLSPNDFIELFVSNESGTANITVKRLNVTIDGKFT